MSYLDTANSSKETLPPLDAPNGHEGNGQALNSTPTLPHDAPAKATGASSGAPALGKHSDQLQHIPAGAVGQMGIPAVQANATGPALTSANPRSNASSTITTQLTPTATGTSTMTMSYPPLTRSERLLTQLPPPDRGPQAYIFLVCAFFVEVVVWGIPSAFGVFLEFYTTHGIGKHKAPASHTLLPWVGTLCQGLMSLFGPPLAWILNPRPHLRIPFIWAGIAILSASLLGSSFSSKMLISPHDVHQTWHLLLSQGIGFAIGGAMVFFPAMGFLNEWFVKRRGMAAGVTYVGTAFGGVCFPFFIAALLARFGDAITLQALACASGVLLGACMPWLKPRLPIPAKRDLRSERDHDTEKRRDDMKRVWKNKGWSMFMISNFMQALAFTITTLFLPSYAASIGLSPSVGSASLAALNAASIFSRIAVGVLSDRKPPHLIASVIMAVSAVSVFLLWGLASTSLAPLLIFSLVFGLACGPWTCLYVAMIKEVASEDLPLSVTLFSFAAFGRGVGTIITAFISSLLLARPMKGAQAWTAFGVADGKFGSVVMFTGAILVVAAATEGIALL
ncbi:BZ3500_MvSof-1268-A1-R1_Chr1-3g02400 [Microbotryum saponariae]|uniref:BZ3500_MvSof-1268-A1-R1_Chr1-3g02400 protein n=1 Tax=Microbotryum saponariae TaxID=289078 RepID=A0A2X0KT98_9BASI|nr:BZ3500_MvSof-1268-A1-R1_Chr1-3g02400 [Microbotryum saponariae]SCZ96187.1 BZ3501_MvSof-1269-A2-R1_Chr1-3g02003 [Microbotryum saponariae]